MLEFQSRWQTAVMYGTVGPRKPNKTSYDSSVIAILLLDRAKDQVDNRTQELDVQLV